jgi:transketolase
MRAMMETEGPMYLRVTRDPSPTIFPADYRFQIGPGVLLRDGADVGLIGTGVQTTRVLEAADLLAAGGIAASVLHLPTLKPIDVDAIVALAERTGRIVTAEDHSIIGGLGSAVAEVLGEHRPTPMRRVGLMDVYGESAPNDYLIEAYGLSAGHVARAAREVISADASLASHRAAGA